MKKKGFSLVELTIVLLIIGLSASLVIPSLSHILKAVELTGVAKRVSAILRYGRSKAINSGQVYQILFDSDLGQVGVQLMGSTEGKEEGKSQQKIYKLPNGVRIKEIKVDSFQYSTDLPAIEFYPNGGSNGGSVLIGNQEDKGYKIYVDCLTGSVAIKRI
jgi:prepilin-type N-terminal cleavage/methylation domain-containing protein